MRCLVDLGKQRLQTEGLVLLSIPAPTRRARALLRLMPIPAFGSDRLLWADPLERESVAAVGAAAELVATGSNRYTQIERDAETLWKRVKPAADSIVTPTRLFGGFAFRPGHANDDPWGHFGEARFILPRLCYQDSPRGASLTLALAEPELSTSARSQGHLAVLHALAEDLNRQLPDDQPVSGPCRRLVSVTHDEQQWLSRVRRARRDIASGLLEKVVTARSIDLSFDAPLDIHTVLAELAQEDPGCTLFAFGWDNLLFLGATPERLISKSGVTIHTEALAGSANSADPSAATSLLASQKDRSEHQLVVSELVSALKPLCETVSCGEGPQVRALRHVVHLHTPLTGRLRKPAHVLRLVDKLHPTPAVGGSPTQAALAWIDREEPTKRGWYASPVGWFDSQGDGRFDMALRSAVFHNSHARLYAGAGIVAASDEQNELDETRLKLQSLLAALGVSS